VQDVIEFDAIHKRQQVIDNEEIRYQFAGDVKGLFAISDEEWMMGSLLRESLYNESPDIGIVLYHQDRFPTGMVCN
jgi:hypothetical protein